MKSEWQPIESAPRDGTPILACTGPYEIHAGEVNLWPDGPITIFWGQYHPNSKGKAEWRDGSGIRRPHMEFWMPLPEPPA